MKKKNLMQLQSWLQGPAPAYSKRSSFVCVPFFPLSFLISVSVACKPAVYKTTVSSTNDGSNSGTVTSEPGCSNIDAGSNPDAYVDCVTKGIEQKSCSGPDCGSSKPSATIQSNTSQSPAKADTSSASALGTEPAAAPDCATEGARLAKPTTQTASTEINIRSNPSTNGSIVGSLVPGDEVTAYSEKQSANFGPWYCVTTADGTSGWAASNGKQWLD